MCIFIYLIESEKNDKKYIGLTMDFKRRIKKYYYSKKY
ncbi:MAG: hypothetical protein COU27_00825 [Candidatus Levybacteria bacterium CG10_big_fil_rev_8_21_14_0_10_36_7]|nr:MAG: hypothetical protein COU27_00825 [Candidatus Levybacteria bacterium CG10_big_fil_rev_8_21_14_0_10_36_7]